MLKWPKIPFPGIRPPVRQSGRPVVDRDLPNPIHQWDDDPEFRKIMALIAGVSLVDVVRCYILYQFARNALALPGDFAEIGVYKGGTARLLGEVSKASSKTLHLFDTFGGMPETKPGMDWHQAGDFGDTTLDAVKGLLSPFDHVCFHPGFFPKTAKPVQDSRFSFVHVDVDIYQSVSDCCDFFFSRLVSGGVMVFDDYGFRTCPGAKAAVDEYFRNSTVPVYLPTGQCIVHRHL